ncbi:MAG: spore cortex biosynthesis protein YabQ [Lachnospiraceae bacterium]|nr:spore cortex biosynthesis protein YabQ [Lachnospiraceae bacterium]
MDEIIHHELQLGIACFCMGILLMALYDVLRIFRRVVKHNIIAISLEDIIFWIICMASAFELLRVMNHGIFRYSVALMAGAGMFLYHLLLGRYAVPFFAKIFNKVKKILKKYNSILTEPLKKAIVKVYRRFKKRLRERKKELEEDGSIPQREKE